MNEYTVSTIFSVSPTVFSPKGVGINIYAIYSSLLRWCSVKQSMWGKLEDQSIDNSSILFHNPLIF
jgi:hypothetical protein